MLLGEESLLQEIDGLVGGELVLVILDLALSGSLAPDVVQVVLAISAEGGVLEFPGLGYVSFDHLSQEDLVMYLFAIR